MVSVDRLKYGDEIRVIAPSLSLSTVAENVRINALDYLSKQGFHVTFSKHCREIDEFGSSTIQSRVDDLHDAIADKNVKAIFAARGGCNVNQILEYIDYFLIKQNPKIICGFSDITALLSAIYTKTGIITYYGPLFNSFGSEDERDYTNESFSSCVMKSEPYKIEPSVSAGSYVVIQAGECEGQLVGGNLCTLNLLQGTQFMPLLNKKILFLENKSNSHSYSFNELDRDLQSLLQVSELKTIKALIFGRFDSSSPINADKIKKIVETKRQLKNIPILYNVDFGHVLPLSTIPIGGVAKIQANSTVSIEIVSH